MTTTRIGRRLAATLVAVTLLSACGGDGDDTSDSTQPDETTTTEATTTTADAAAEEEAVSAVLTEFFALAGQGDLEGASALNENPDYALPRLLHCEALVKGVTIEMISVELVDAETASALFKILGPDGGVLLAESGGGAVKVDGEWLVSDNTFRSLYDAASAGCAGPPPPPE